MKKNGTGGETHINMVSYGGGVNSTALLIGLHQHRIPVDLILFADTGAEHPHTYVTDMSREQMEAAGYGLHHQSDDGKYLIMGNGARAFAVLAEQPEKDNPLRTAEMTVEDDYGMIDGVINNGRKGEELETAKTEAARTSPEKRPSIRDRLAEAKRECGERKPPDRAQQKKLPEHDL